MRATPPHTGLLSLVQILLQASPLPTLLKLTPEPVRPFDEQLIATSQTPPALVAITIPTLSQQRTHYPLDVKNGLETLLLKVPPILLKLVPKKPPPLILSTESLDPPRQNPLFTLYTDLSPRPAIAPLTQTLLLENPTPFALSPR